MYITGTYPKKDNDITKSDIHFVLDTIQVFETEAQARQGLMLSMINFADDVLHGVLGHSPNQGRRVHDNLSKAARQIGRVSTSYFSNDTWEVEVDEGTRKKPDVQVWYIRPVHNEQ